MMVGLVRTNLSPCRLIPQTLRSIRRRVAAGMLGGERGHGFSSLSKLIQQRGYIRVGVGDVSIDRVRH
jgi:hypothetical protein